MKSRIPTALLLALLAVAFFLVVTVRKAGREAKNGSAGSAAPAAKSDGASSAKQKRDRRATPVSSQAAAERMRALLEAGVDDAPSFEEIDALARRLSEEDLRELIARAGLANLLALVPWVRCALYAEWGRRDPEAAMAYLRNPETENSTEGWSTRQAWFSLFRGWSERDPDAALAALSSADFRAVHEDPNQVSGEAMRWDRFWQDYAYEAVFRELVRREGASAWDKIPPVGSKHFSALRGIFWGAEGSEERLALVTRWGPEWSSAAGSSNPQAFHQKEALGVAAGVSLAELDLEIAKEWLGTLDSPPVIRAGRYANVLHAWAARDPDGAFARLPGAEEPDVIPLVQGILRTDLKQGVEALLHIEDQAQRFGVLQLHVQQGSSRLDDFFPGLGQRTQLPGQPGRQEALAAAIEAGGFSADQTTTLHAKLERAFSAEP